MTRFFSCYFRVGRESVTIFQHLFICLAAGCFAYTNGVTIFYLVSSSRFGEYYKAEIFPLIRLLRCRYGTSIGIIVHFGGVIMVFRWMKWTFGGVKWPSEKWVGPSFGSCPLLTKMLCVRLPPNTKRNWGREPWLSSNVVIVTGTTVTRRWSGSGIGGNPCCSKVVPAPAAVSAADSGAVSAAVSAAAGNCCWCHWKPLAGSSAGWVQNPKSAEQAKGHHPIPMMPRILQSEAYCKPLGATTELSYICLINIISISVTDSGRVKTVDTVDLLFVDHI